MSKNCVEVIGKPLGDSNKKPIVISSSKYAKIINTIQAEEALKKVSDEEQRYKDYLKQGSEEIVSNWTTNLKRTQDQKQSERHGMLMDKLQKEKAEFLKIREKDEHIRRERITKAQELIQKLQPGPKELQSAAIQSETIKSRAVQRNITKEFEESFKKHTVEEQFQMECQAMPWIEEEQTRISNNIRHQKQYKAEILNTINEKARKKAEHCTAQLIEHKISRDILDEEVKAQIEREQDIMKRKREALRKNALEAMIMTEQRKAREQVNDRIESNLIAVYNDGKRNIDNIRKDRVAQSLQDALQRNVINAQNLVALTADRKKAEDERYRKDISRIQLQFTAQEKEKVEKSRQQKHARIQEYFNELNSQKVKKQRNLEEARLSAANRLKNEEINSAFERKQKEYKMKKTQEVAKALTEQVEERKHAEAEIKERDKMCNAVNFDKEDKFFFDYANNLVSVAVEKDRPLYPFIKTVRQYKKDNGIDVERKLPPHLESHLCIGVKTPPDNIAFPPGVTVRKYGLDELKDLNPYSPRSVSEK